MIKPQSVGVTKDNNGTTYILLVERGKTKAQVKTAYKKKNQIPDVTSPERNVQNDSDSSSAENISQKESEGKGIKLNISEKRIKKCL